VRVALDFMKLALMLADVLGVGTEDQLRVFARSAAA
jgi:hypothetical protein